MLYKYRLKLGQNTLKFTRKRQDQKYKFTLVPDSHIFTHGLRKNYSNNPIFKSRKLATKSFFMSQTFFQNMI